MVGCAMTRAEFNALPADGMVACPDCGGRGTEPHPNCHCPPNDLSPFGTKHINLWHHVCPKAQP